MQPAWSHKLSSQDGNSAAEDVVDGVTAAASTDATSSSERSVGVDTSSPQSLIMKLAEEKRYIVDICSKACECRRHQPCTSCPGLEPTFH